MSDTLLALVASRDGVIVPVTARPRGRRDALIGARHGSLLIETTAAPEDGAANDAIGKLLARSLAVARGSVTLTSGSAARRKRFCIAQLSLDVVGARLTAALQKEL